MQASCGRVSDENLTRRLLFCNPASFSVICPFPAGPPARPDIYADQHRHSLDNALMRRGPRQKDPSGGERGARRSLARTQAAFVFASFSTVVAAVKLDSASSEACLVTRLTLS